MDNDSGGGFRSLGAVIEERKAKVTGPCPLCGRQTDINLDKNRIECRSFECGYTAPIPESLLLRLAGAPELPLFGGDDETV